MYKNGVNTTEKRKGIYLFLALSAALMLSACGTTDTPASGNAAQSGETWQTQSAASETPDDQKDTESSQEASAEETPQPEADEAYQFEYKGVVIAVDADVAPVIEALGEPKGYFEAASCAFEGLDKIYTYNDFEISTRPAKDADLISLIVFRSDIISTPEGISIGATVSKVNDIYGESAPQDGMIVYEKGGMKLCFIIKDEKVASVEYHSSAQD